MFVLLSVVDFVGVVILVKIEFRIIIISVNGGIIVFSVFIIFWWCDKLVLGLIGIVVCGFSLV